MKRRGYLAVGERIGLFVDYVHGRRLCVLPNTYGPRHSHMLHGLAAYSGWHEIFRREKARQEFNTIMASDAREVFRRDPCKNLRCAEAKIHTN